MKTIDDMVHGHKRAKRMLQAVLRRSQDRYHKKCVLNITESIPDTLKCLLIGPSGTGKTHLLHSLQKIHDFPLLCLDSTQLSPGAHSEGIDSKKLTQMITKKAADCLADSKRMHDGRYHSVEGVLNQLVVFIDEFDKLGNCFESSGLWNKQVQSSFLTLIDNKEQFSGVSWVFAGAFSPIYETKQNTKGMGFFTPPDRQDTSRVSDRDIIKAGIIPEMLGRISLIVELDTFTASDYRTVLIERMLPNYDTLASMEHTEIDEIVAMAMKSSQGLRSMTRQLEMLAIEKEADVYCFSPKI